MPSVCTKVKEERKMIRLKKKAEDEEWKEYISDDPSRRYITMTKTNNVVMMRWDYLGKKKWFLISEDAIIAEPPFENTTGGIRSS